jgi:uncharacterized protein YjdB
MQNSYKLLLCLIMAILTGATSFADPIIKNETQKRVPLSFIENKGQITDQDRKERHDIQFSLKAAGGLAIFIGDGAIHYQFSKDNNSGSQPSMEDIKGHKSKPVAITFTMDRMDVELVGANKNTQIITEQKQGYYEDYFTDQTGEKGATAYTYNRITYKNIYPNIDWVLYTSNGTLEHEFVIRLGGKVSDIKLKYGGAKELKISADGSLTASTPQGIITEKAPDTYQKDGKKVSSSFVLNGAVLSYNTGDYTGELVIDPTLSWGTYFGGTGYDECYSVATDNSGNIYMSGYTNSTSAIATSGAYHTTYAGGVSDAVLSKFNSAGVLQWATYYGGSSNEFGFSVATDGSGNVFMAGYTQSTTGIATSGAYQTTHGGGLDAFLAKFNSSGAIQWSTYYGGSGNDQCLSVTTDGSGNVYMTGATTSATAIATIGAYQTAYAGGGDDAFLVKFNSSGARQWATYYGGNDSDIGYSIKIDVSGNIYIAGATTSTTGLALTGAFQITYGGGSDDAFLVQFNSSGVPQWATYYGGSSNDEGTGITTDGSGNVYMTGYTASTSAIATSGAYQTTYGGGGFYGDAFLVKFNSTGARQWATYFGGSGDDYGNGITDASGNVYITGNTGSTSAIATSGAYQSTFGGGTYDVFLAKFSYSGGLQWATYYGGSGDEAGLGVATDGSGNIDMTGYTQSTSAIATSGAYQTTYGGSDDAFLAQFSCSFPTVSPITGPTAVCPGSTITLSDATSGGTWSSSNTAIATVTSGGLVTGIIAGYITISYSVTDACGTTVAMQQVAVGVPIITTFAGIGLSPGLTGDGGPATAAKFSSLHSVFVDAAGNTLIADNGNHKIRVIDASGIVRTIAGTGVSGFSGDGFAATNATMKNPFSVIEDAAGNVYFSDYDNSRVRQISTSGIITTIAGNGIASYSGDGGQATAAGLQGAAGLSFDVAGNLYIGDVLNHRVRKVTPSGIISTFAGTGVLGAGGDGSAATLAQLYNPNFVHADAFGNVYITDNGNHKIRMVNASGIISTVAGNGVNGSGGDGGAAIAAQLSYPGGVAFDGAGNMYIAGDGNQKVRMVNAATGIMSTFAGTGVTGFSGDGGTPAAAKLNIPVDVAFDNNGNLLIVDLSNSVIRKVAPIGAPGPIFAPSTTICQGSSVIFTDASSDGIWTSSTPGVASVGSSTGTVTGVAAGTATITYTITYSCGSYTAVQPVTVNAFYAGIITGPSIVCPGNTIALSNSTTGGTWSSDNTAIATVSSSGIVTGVAPGGVAISYTLPSSSCGTPSTAILITVGTPMISTIAGTGVSGFTGEGLAATVATLNSPSGVYVDAAGAIFIADFNNNAIRKINTSGIITTIAGTGTPGYTGDGGAATLATLKSPIALTGDAAGNIYVAEFNNHVIRKISTSGIITTVAGNGSGGYVADGVPATSTKISGPEGIVVDAAGNLFIADNFNNRIRKVNTSGIISTIAGTGLASFSGDGGQATAAAIRNPYGIYLDADGNFYICDQANSRIRKVNTSGIISTIAGSGISGFAGDGGAATAAAVRLNGAVGVFTDKAGNVYIADRQNSAIRKITTATGIISTIAGVGGSPGYVDNVMPTAARLVTPNGIFIDDLANIYITDASGNRVRKVAPIDAVVAPIAGASTLCQGGATPLTDATPGGGWTSSAPGTAGVGSLTGVVTGISTGTANISYTVAFGCGNITAVKTVTVNTTPSLSTPITGPTTICIGALATLANVTPGGIWTAVTPSVANIGSTSGNITGLSVGITTVSYSITTSCGSAAAVRFDTVAAFPSAISGTPSVCVGATTALSDPTTGGAWSSSATATATVGLTGIVTGITPGVTTISYTSAAGCAVTMPVTVQITPAALSPASAAVCPGNTATFTNAIPGGVWSSVAAGTASILSGVVTGVSAGTTSISYTIGTCAVGAPVTVNIPPAAITPAGAVSMCLGATAALADAIPGGTWSSATPGAATVSLTGIVTGISAGTTNISYTSGLGCSVVKTVTVLVTPSALSPSSAIVCTGNTITLTDAIPGGVWASAGPATASVAGGVVTGVTVGTTNISYTIGTCFVTAPVTVNLSPSAGAITGPSFICTGTPATYTDASPGGVWSSSNPAVASVGLSGVVSGLTGGTTTISYSVSNSCGTVVAIKSITVSVTATAGVIIGASTVCAGTFTSLVDAIPGGIWSASNSTATISGIGLLTGITPGTDTIRYTVINSCGTATATKIVTIGTFLSAGIISGPTSVCEGAAIILTDGILAGVWSSSNASASVIGGTVTGLVGGIDTISYTVTASCGIAVATKIITVIPVPEAGTISGPFILCAGAIVTYTDATPGGVWGVSNAFAAISGGGIVTALSPGTDTITYIVTNACGADTASLALSIGASISAGVISGPGTVCEGAAITLTDASPGGSWSATNLHATIIAGIVTGVTAGADTIMYTVSSGCGSVSASAVVIVNPLADAGSIAGPATLCMSTTATYTNAAPGGVWSMSNGNATITGGGLATPVAAGADTISYSVSNGCGTMASTAVINIILVPVAGTISGPGNICIGSTATLTDAVPGGVWSASNGNAAVVAGLVTGISSGIDTIYYTVASTCGTAVAMKIVAINLIPSPGVITGPSAVCVGSLIPLADAVTGGAWSASNTSATISIGGLVTGITPGLDTISYTVTNACGSFATTHVITVNTGSPSPGVISGPVTVCTGFSITLTDPVLGGVWSSSNSSATVLGGVVTGITTGTDTISYMVSSGCGSATATYTITIGAGIFTGVISGSSVVCVGSTITLTDPVTGGIWSSSNANATVSGSGVVTGVTTGTATISYTFTGSCGVAAATQAITIGAPASAGTISGPTGVCAGASITLTNATAGGVWSASNSKATVSSAGVVTGVLSGVDTIKYTVTSACGSVVASRSIAVNSAPGAGSISGASSICPGVSVTLAHSVSGGTWTSSNIGIAAVSSLGVVTGITSGAAIISYTVSNSCGHASATRGMTVLSPGSCAGLLVNGVAANQDEELKVSPNPNSGTFNINLVSTIDEEVQIIIVNVLGEKVKEFITTTNKVIDLKLSEAPGVYLLSASTAHGRHVAKVIVN